MMKIIRFVNTAMNRLSDALQKAVPAFTNKGAMPRWRNMGQQVTPYHFLKPVPVPVQQKRK
ncbi:MAG: hypothetical protein JNL72_11670 [Flavipsychrobacter sp.]|nr:hypothetical protein [Flavipsychrobacter sp.]